MNETECSSDNVLRRKISRMRAWMIDNSNSLLIIQAKNVIGMSIQVMCFL